MDQKGIEWRSRNISVSLGWVLLQERLYVYIQNKRQVMVSAS